MTRWWLIPAIVLGTMIWAALFAAVVADEIYRWTDQNYVTIQPSSRPGVVAEVFFVNDITHQRGSETFTVELDGLPVEVEFRMNTHGADDTILVTPPAGYIAEPPNIVVPEGGAGVVLILEEATS